MGSGGRELQINTRERPVSNDHNRMQAIARAHLAELLRWMIDSSSPEVNAGGFPTAPAVTGNPLRGEIFGGLWARPDVGTVNLFIEPGVVGIVNPDAVPDVDDSPYKVIDDPGVQTAGALTLTAGAVATRIDVIECSRVDVVLEQDNRDIFNQATGIFTPQLVDKVIAERLTYRIRTGVAGAGFPGTAAGWLPLAVASVPSTATTWNDCTVWDVRPLVSDYVRAPFNVEQTFPHLHHAYATAVDVGGADRKLRGVIEAEYLGRKLGGELGPSILTGSIDLLSSEVLEPGFAVTPNRPWFLYFLTPFGLPRWAKYSPASAGFRRPASPRGIPVFTQKGPGGMNMKPGAAVSIPTALGLGGNTQDGCVAMTGAYNAASGWLDSVLADGWTRFGISGNASGITVSPAAGAGTAVVSYDLTDNVTHPLGATALRLRFRTTVTTAVGNDVRKVRVLDATNAIMFEHEDAHAQFVGTSNDVFEIEIPLNAIAGWPAGTAVTRRVTVEFTNASGYADQLCQVIGWKMGMG